MWTTEKRARYDRDTLRYPSDVTGEEWAELAPLIPPARRGGRKRSVNIREVFNGRLYVLSTGCQWRAIPKDFRRAVPSSITLVCGRPMARSVGFTPHCM